MDDLPPRERAKTLAFCVAVLILTLLIMATVRL
jgi:hypothetical protein